MFFVKDYLGKEFFTGNAVRSIPILKIGFPLEVGYFRHKTATFLPRADVVLVYPVIEFFKTNKHGLDSLFYEAEGDSSLDT